MSVPDPTTNPNPGPKPKPFPAITGSCVCNTIRYRLLTSPLFCYACHCPDCQKLTGSAFGLFLNIEASAIQILSLTPPVFTTKIRSPPHKANRHFACPTCKVELWSENHRGPAIVDVRVGTLGFPSLMEPDVHSFVESKVDWVRLPEEAKTTERDFNYKELWPKSSLKRLDLCLQQFATEEQRKQERVKEAVEAHVPGHVQVERGVKDEGAKEDVLADGEKTPTAGEFEEKLGDEDDEAFEKRFKETEEGLQDRLEALRLKLEEGESGKDKAGPKKIAEKKDEASLEQLTEKLNITDAGSKSKDDDEKGSL